MENKVIKQQMDINKLRNEIEMKKGNIKAYQMHIKDKAIRRQTRINLLKRQQKRCPDCDIGFMTDAQLDKHIATIHTEDKEYMIRIAKDYNDKMQDDDEEEMEVMKDMIENTQVKMIETIRQDIRPYLNQPSRDHEIAQLHQKFEETLHEIQIEKEIAKELIKKNDITPLMTEFEEQIRSMFKEVHKKLEKDVDDEHERDEQSRKIQQDLLTRIEQRDKTINKLKEQQHELEEKHMHESLEMNNTFARDDRMLASGSISDRRAQLKSIRQIEKEKQEREITQMELEDLRMKQIVLEEKRVRQMKEIEFKMKKDAEKQLTEVLS